MISVLRKKQFPKVSLFKRNNQRKAPMMNAVMGVIRKQRHEPCPVCTGLCRERFPPHVDVKRLGDVDFEASRPGAVGRVHESDTQQLVVVVTGPVEDHAGAWQGGDVALWIGCALGQMC